MSDRSARAIRALRRSATPLAADAVAAITAVSGVRYAVLHHALPAHALVLLIAACLTVGAATVAVLGARRRVPRWATPTLTVLLGVLVLLAPSFAWAAVPLIVLLHAEISIVSATAWSVVAVAIAAFSIPRLTDRADPGLLAGCLLAGLVLVGALVGMRTAVASSNRLLREVIATRARLVDAERRAGAATERQRIAAELHDTVVQSAAGALFLVEASERSGAMPDGAGSEARVALRAALTEARGLVDRLETDDERPTDLLAELHAAAGACDADVHVHGTPRQLDPGVEHAALRIVQSALGNAQRHAGAERTDVHVTFDPDALVVLVSDDGCGFDPTTVSAPGADGGHGFAIMHRRAALVGGSLTVETGDQGTTVAGRLPIIPRLQEGAP